MKRSSFLALNRCSSVNLTSERPQITRDDLLSLRTKTALETTLPQGFLARLTAALRGRAAATGAERAQP